MNEAEKEEMLKEHIPYRLTSIDGLRFVCEILLQHGDSANVRLYFDDRRVLATPSCRLLTNPVLEVGAIYCRVLLEFLGIGLERRTGRLKEKSRAKRQDGDIWIEDFGLKRVSVAQVRSAGTGKPDEVEEACVDAILTAHRAVAHLTYGLPGRPELGRLRTGAYTVLRLVEEHLYRRLDLEIPHYSKWPTL
jgi:hypothetical protein